ncbi:MAG TPA: MFS transporter [Rhizomicrobium sp.]|jgi:MFS family permease|nr:MFS transporter [Rhizomicrobium sp.]
MDAAKRARRLSLIAILSSCMAFAIGMGLTLPLLSLILERRGFPGAVNGMNLATAGLAAFFVTPQVPGFIRRFGTARYLGGSLVLAAAALVAIYETPSLWLWFPVRFCLSVGLNGLFVASEFWINQLADEHNRGRYIALYGTAISVGFGIGPAVLFFVGTHGILPFALGSGMLLFAIIPLFLARHEAPRLDEEHAHGVFGAVRAAPTILLAAFVFGAIDAGLGGLFPVYAVRSGYDEAHAALALTAMSLGSMVFQYPLGMLADRFDRRMLMIVCASAGIVGAGLTPLAIGVPAAMYVLLFFWGGIVMGIYTIGLTLLGERFKGPALASANAAYIMLYSIGLLGGPLAEGVALDAWNPHGLMVVLAAISTIYVLFLILRPQVAAPSPP